MENNNNNNNNNNYDHYFGSGSYPFPTRFGITAGDILPNRPYTAVVRSTVRVPPRPENSATGSPALAQILQGRVNGSGWVVRSYAGGGSSRVRSVREDGGGDDEENRGRRRKRWNALQWDPRGLSPYSDASFSSAASSGTRNNPHVRAAPVAGGPHVSRAPQVPIINRSSLIFLFGKELQRSDVSEHYRIVLPKKSAESHLPAIRNADGFPIQMEDMQGVLWEFRFRFWSNNRSRMYVLENTGNFIMAHGLQSGDSIFLYRERLGQKYVIEPRKRTCNHDAYTSIPRDARHPQAVAPGPASARATVAIEARDQARTEDGAFIDHADVNVDDHPLINELKFYSPASATAPVTVETREASEDDYPLIYELKVYNPNLDDPSLQLNYGQLPSRRF